MMVDKTPFNAQSYNDKKSNIFFTTRCCLGRAISPTLFYENYTSHKATGFNYFYTEGSFAVYDSPELQLSYRSFAYNSPELQLSYRSFAYDSPELQLSYRSFAYDLPGLQLSYRSFVYNLPDYKVCSTSSLYGWLTREKKNLLFTTNGQIAFSTAFILKHHGAIF